MNLPLFLARRIARPTPDNKPGVMVRIAEVSVAVSVAVMIVALAVILGFKREISARIGAVAPAIEVADVHNLYWLQPTPVRCSEALEELIRTSTPALERIAPYAQRGGVLRTAEGMSGVVLKGLDDRYDWSLLASSLVEGKLPRVGDSVRTKDLLVSAALARELRLQVDDRVELLFFEAEGAPRRDRFRVSGLYATGLDELDRALALTDLRNVQRLYGWSLDEVTGYELTLRDLRSATDVASDLRFALSYAWEDEVADLTARSVQESFPTVFDWLRTHDVNAAVILVIMTVVALFNTAAAVLTLVLERTRMIGILKALGMRNESLVRLFLLRGGRIVVRGVLWGNLVGVGLCLLQRTTHLVQLDPEGYFLSEVPVALDLPAWLLLNAGTVAVIVLLLVLPCSILARIRPDESIRYNQ